MCKTKNYNIKRGDTFNEVLMQFKKNNVVFNLTGCEFKMQLRKTAGGEIAKNVTVSITDAVNGWFKIDKQIFEIEAFEYLYDLQIKYSNNDVTTLYGGIFKVVNDITRP
jgi:hypothetical protein